METGSGSKNPNPKLGKGAQQKKKKETVPQNEREGAIFLTWDLISYMKYKGDTGKIAISLQSFAFHSI